MLERTAGCLENAGRRFFQDSNSTIRSQRALYSNLRQYNATTLECSNWRFASRHTTQRRASSTSSAARTPSDPRTPVLEFLYPSRTQQFVASCLLQSSRGILPRRRKKSAPSISRPFVSEAASLHRSVEVDKTIASPPDFEREGTGTRGAREKLLKLLESGGPQRNDKAWELFVQAGQPFDVISALLTCLSNSPRDDDFKRVKFLFRAIPENLHSPEDYLNLIKSSLAVRRFTDAVNICEQAAVLGRAVPCWGFTLAYFINNSKWSYAFQLWSLRRTSRYQDLWSSVSPHLIVSSVPKRMLELSELPLDEATNSSAHSFAHFFLQCGFGTLELFRNTPTETLLLLLQRYRSIGFLTAEHYFTLIRSFQSSEVRSTFIRSIVVYRNFRWLMDGEVPPANLLHRFLTRLAFFEITAGIEYFLDEFTVFHSMPTVDAYKQALICYSRTGEVSNVNSVFERFVSDHGKPSSRRLLTPLLHVHARLGNVEETATQFKRISEEFGLEQNTVCWNILLTAYANADDFAGCLTQFQKMIEEGVGLNSHTFGILMGLCANRGDVSTARRLLALAKQRKVQITAPLLDTIVEAYCNNQDLELAESVAESCLGLDVKGSRLRMWNLLLWNYAFRMDLESISRVRQRMDTAGLQPDSMTFAALMLSLVLLGQTDSARRILRTLHRGHRMHATEFHYAIILYGYVRERNRDMVHIIFREIKARFNRPGLSSRLLVLKSQLQRDLQLLEHRKKEVSDAALRLQNAEKFLAETIAEYNPARLATKQPVPGTGKQPLTKAFPAAYYEYVIRAYGKRGALEKVRELFDQYIRNQPRVESSGNAHDIAPLRLLTALMQAYLKADQFNKVEECWAQGFRRAQGIAKPPKSSDGWLSSQLGTNTGVESSHPSLLDLSGDSQSLLAPDIPETSDTANQLLILPTYRFMLSRPLSIYMRSLAYRNATRRIPQVVKEVEGAGFSLTTFNWSTFVQMLASSDKSSDQLEAFSMFEEKFMPNFPGWDNLRRGYGLKPPGVPSTIDAMENPSNHREPHLLGKEARRYWSKISPDFMQPTYVSMVYLASALQGVRERSILDGGAELSELHTAAPKTIEAIAEMPYLRERFQGVLLRRRQEQGDARNNEAGKDYFVWTGGVLGVGGQRRAEVVEPSTEPASQEDHLSEEVSQIGDQFIEAREDLPAPSPFAVDESSNDDGALPLVQTLDPQDEYDLEAESLLAMRRRLLGTDEELLDNGHSNISYIGDDGGPMFGDEFAFEDEELQDCAIEHREDTAELHEGTVEHEKKLEET